MLGWRALIVRPAPGASSCGRRTRPSCADSRIDDDLVVMGREPADRIGGRRVARQPRAPGTGSRPKSSSWRPSGHDRHGSCIQPVPRKRANASDSFQIQASGMVADVGEGEPGDRRRRLAGQDVAVRARPPARSGPSRPCTAWAGPRRGRGAPRGPRPWARHARGSAARPPPRAELLPRRQQRLLVEHGPAVVLGVRELEPLGAQIEGQLEQVLDPIEVLAVQDAVDRQREVQLPGEARGRDLLLKGPVARDAVVVGGVRALDRDLHVVESGRLQRRRALRREQGARGDERGVEPRRRAPRRTAPPDRGAASARRRSARAAGRRARAPRGRCGSSPRSRARRR